jgi:hypothetical protein
MPSTIPYNPSLVLGNLISLDKITKLQAIAKAQKPADLAQDSLNSLILNKHKLDMTFQEMVNMGVSVKDLKGFEKTIEKLKEDIATHASAYGKAVMASTKAVEGTKASDGTTEINEAPESPIDWNKSDIKKMPLSSDTMNVDVQYLRNEHEKDGNEAHASSVASAVSGAMGGIFEPTLTSQMSGSAKNSTLNQTSKHDIEGTLVITATCTHKIADVFAPFVMDPDKAIAAWNMSYPGKILDTTSEKAMEQALATTAADKDKLHLLSGQTMGSSFVGMVHIIQTEKSSSTQSENARSAEAQATARWGGFLTYAQGEFGLSTSASDKIQDLLSSSEVSSHCCLITMGLIPSLKSEYLTTTISSLKPKATEVMGQLNEIQHATDSEVNSTAAGAKKAREGKQFMTLDNGYLTNAVTAVHEAQNHDNKVIDLNSLMTAFDDFVKKAAADDACGVPINFFVREITKSDIAKAYLKKYSPLKNWQLSSDDDTSSAGATS